MNSIDYRVLRTKIDEDFVDASSEFREALLKISQELIDRNVYFIDNIRDFLDVLEDNFIKSKL